MALIDTYDQFLALTNNGKEYRLDNNPQNAGSLSGTTSKHSGIGLVIRCDVPVKRTHGTNHASGTFTLQVLRPPTGNLYLCSRLAWVCRGKFGSYARFDLSAAAIEELSARPFVPVAPLWTGSPQRGWRQVNDELAIAQARADRLGLLWDHRHPNESFETARYRHQALLDLREREPAMTAMLACDHVASHVAFGAAGETQLTALLTWVKQQLTSVPEV